MCSFIAQYPCTHNRVFQCIHYASTMQIEWSSVIIKRTGLEIGKQATFQKFGIVLITGVIYFRKKIAKKKERGLGLIVLSGWKCLTKKKSFLISLLEFLINLILILIIWHSESSIQIVRWFLYFFLFQSFTFAMGLSCKKTSVRVLVWIEIVIEIFKFSISLIFNDYRGPRVRSCIIFTIIDDMPNFFSRPKGSVQFRHCPFLSSNWNLSSRRKLKLSKFKRFSSK